MVNLYDKAVDGSTARDWYCVEHPRQRLTGIPFTRVGDPLFCYEGDHVPERVERRDAVEGR